MIINCPILKYPNYSDWLNESDEDELIKQNQEARQKLKTIDLNLTIDLLNLKKNKRCQTQMIPQNFSSVNSSIIEEPIIYVLR